MTDGVPQTLDHMRAGRVLQLPAGPDSAPPRRPLWNAALTLPCGLCTAPETRRCAASASAVERRADSAVLTVHRPCTAGGDLQPFFAQRNIDPGASMKSNQFVTPVAPDSRADHELAIALARLEHQQRSGAPAVTISRAQATAAQPAGRPVALRVPGGNQPTAAPSSSSGSQYDGFRPAGGHGGLPQRPPAEAAPPLHYVGRASAAAPPMGYQNGQGYHNGHYQSGHRSAAPRGAPCAHSMQGEVHGNDAAAPPPAAISAAIENLTMAGT